jgi:hypothetical protein
MIGELPVSLEVGGKNYPIRSDFRVAMIIFQAYNNPELSSREKNMACLQCLYVDIPEDVSEALEKAAWFLDGGGTVKMKRVPAKVIDWEQDEGLLFAEINKSAGYEVRFAEYVHFWTFLGFLGTMGEGLYPQILNIRQKRAKGKPLDKWERDLFEEYKEIIIIREKLTAAEQAELDEEQAFIDSIC